MTPRKLRSHALSCIPRIVKGFLGCFPKNLFYLSNLVHSEVYFDIIMTENNFQK